MNKRKAALWVVVVGLVVGAGRSQARACSCAPPGPPAEALQTSAAVFDGELLEDRLDAGGLWGRTMTFKVLRAWKGVTAGTTIAIATGASSAACGHDETRNPGTRMLVYATSSEGRLVTTLCSRTTFLTDAAEDIGALGPPSSEASPLPGSAATSKGRPAGNGCAVSPTSLIYERSIFGVPAIMVIGLLVARRRRRSV